MVGSGDLAHHTSVVGTVLACHVVCASTPPGHRSGRTRGSLVSQTTADLLGHVSVGTAAALAHRHFLDVRWQGRCRDNSQGALCPPDRYARVCSLIWTKPNLEHPQS